MIYISSSCSKEKKIIDAIISLNKMGFKNIELSGGTNYYSSIEKDLNLIKDKLNLNFLIHNYFPPPKQHFTLNLASLNDIIFEKTINHMKKSIVLCEKIKSKKFGIHAGFYTDIKVNELGKKIDIKTISDKQKAEVRFCKGLEILSKNAFSKGVTLYIENNVLSYENFKYAKNESPFMLTDFDSYLRLKEKIDFNLLLDIAHLKVSCNSLKKNFQEQVKKMSNLTDYIHLSNNNSLADQNKGFSRDLYFLDILKGIDLKNKDITIEIYDDATEIINSYLILKDMI